MPPETNADATLPPVPLTVEGAAVLHQVMRLRWPAWRSLPAGTRSAIVEEATRALSGIEKPADGRQSAIYALLGHKGDLMFVHFRRTFEELHEAQRNLARLRLSDYLESTTSYLSVVELGLYESTSDTYAELARRDIQPHSEEWNREIEAVLDRHRKAMAPRLWPRFRPVNTSAFTPWTGAGESRGTGTRNPWRTASA